MSNPTASASVAPNESAIKIQVRPTRRPKRSAAPRKREKKRTSGRPSWAELCWPGSGKEIESALKTCGWFSTISFVGPRATEKMSTGTIRTAIEETQESASKKERNHHATATTAANFTKFAAMSRLATSRTTVRR